MPYKGIESVVHGASDQCLKAIFDVHFEDSSLVADLTWGKGRFWKLLPGLNVTGMDADPRGGASIVSDYRSVPLADQSVDVAVFDPPFIFTPGLRGIVGSKRFFLGSDKTRFYEGPHSDCRIQAPSNAKELLNHTLYACHEMKRIAKKGMILKGQDLVTQLHPNWWTFDVMYLVGRELDIVPEDMLIQVSPAARLHDPRWKKQLHFRRRHAIYLVYKFQ